MKHLNLILIILILSCCPLHPAYAFFDKDIRLLTMRDGLATTETSTISPPPISEKHSTLKRKSNPPERTSPSPVYTNYTSTERKLETIG